MNKFDIGERNVHWQCYLDTLKDVCSKYVYPRVLKMDGYNELLDVPVDGGIANNVPGADFTVLEYEMLFARKVAQLYPNINVVQGDIRDLKFDDNSFDVIADLSTLDHVSFKSVPSVLDGYRRVIKLGGKLVLFVWVTTNPMVSGETEKRHEVWQSISQYFFDYESLKQELSKRFFIESEKATPNTGTEGDTWLDCFVCERR